MHHRLVHTLMTLALLLPGLALGHHLVIGQPAPTVVLQTLDGHHIDTRDLKGKVVLVTFWASWCSPCRDELPLLSAYAKEHAGQDLAILAISLDSSEDLPTVRAIAAPLGFPAGLLEQASLSGYGRIWRIPVSFVIDRQGRLIDNGWEDADPVWTRARLEHEITPLLKNPAS